MLPILLQRTIFSFNSEALFEFENNSATVFELVPCKCRAYLSEKLNKETASFCLVSHNAISVEAASIFPESRFEEW
jgi:hypothetical protein